MVLTPRVIKSKMVFINLNYKSTHEYTLTDTPA